MIIPVFLCVIRTVYTSKLTYNKAWAVSTNKRGVLGQRCACVPLPHVGTYHYSLVVFLFCFRTYKRKTDATPITEELLEKARNLISEGFSRRQAATKLHLKESSLRKRLKLFLWTRRFYLWLLSLVLALTVLFKICKMFLTSFFYIYYFLMFVVHNIFQFLLHVNKYPIYDNLLLLSYHDINFLLLINIYY